jgi:hypothetical protein
MNISEKIHNTNPEHWNRPVNFVELVRELLNADEIDTPTQKELGNAVSSAMEVGHVSSHRFADFVKFAECHITVWMESPIELSKK